MNWTRGKSNLLMQPRGLSKPISYLSKSVSKNTRRQIRGWTRRSICWRFKSPTRDPNISVEEAWVAHQEPTPSRVSFKHFPNSTKLLLHSLRRSSRPSQTFSQLSTTLGAQRVTNVMKIASQSLSAQRLTKRILSTQTWISHKSYKPHKKVLGRAHKGLGMSVFHGWHQHPPKEGGGKLL
jgi:hypothetical protein